MDWKTMIMDVGCGQTLGEKQVDKEHYRVPFQPTVLADVFVDLRRPEFRFRTLYTSSEFVQADARNLPFQGKVFRQIYARHLIEHLPNPGLFLRECRRTLQKQGVLHVWVPNLFSRYATNRRLGSGSVDPTHIQVFSARTLPKMMRNMGFRIAMPCPLISMITERIPAFFRFLLTYVLPDELYVIGEKT